NPQHADAYSYRGNAYLSKGQYDLAINDYDKMIELNPQDVYVYINKAFACEKSGNYTSSQIEALKQKIRDLGGQI
ncbi:MAG: tetratricopeptide repeat protein, partial [Sporomusaceae bacterium]|nr:tetratricopeptide repeat protein [Sporomusaceae bacterium]